MSRKSSTALQTVRQWQSEADAIRETAEPTRARSAVFMLTAMLVVLLGMSPFMQLDRVVTSVQGKIVSSESVLTFQALDDSSIVKSIDVKEGQQVEAGQLLATLDPTFTAADVSQLRLQIASLDAQLTRANAELHKAPLVFPASPSVDELPYIALQKAYYQQRQQEFTAQDKSYAEKMKTTEATIAKVKADMARYSDREEISHKIEGMRDTLYKSGSSSLLNLLQANDARLEMLRQKEYDQNSLVESEHQLSSTTADRDAFIQQWMSQISQEIVTANNSRDTAVSQLQKASKHHDLVKLIAPEQSIVLTVTKGLSVGSVMKMGDVLMTMVPTRTPMEAEIWISSKDIGYVRAGDPAVLKVDAFSFVEHGTAEGVVHWISEGAFTTDDNGQPIDPYYKARVTIKALHFIAVPSSFRLVPGMTLTGDVKVGSRSLLAYVGGSVIRGASEAMREP